MGDSGPSLADSQPADRNLLGRLWSWLTSPSPALTNPAARIQARILSAMLLTTMVLGALTAAIPGLVSPELDLWEDPIFWITLGGVGLLGAAYALSRTAQYKLGALLAIGILTAAILAASLMVKAPEAPGMLLYLLIPVLLSSMFFSLRTTILATAGLVLAVLAVPLVFPTISLLQILIGPFSFLLVLGTLFILLLVYHIRLEGERLAALAQSEQRYRGLTEQSPDLISVTIDHKAVYMNLAGLALLGASKLEDLQGHTMFDLVHPDDLPRVNRWIEELTPTSWEQVELRLLRLNGEVLEVEGSAILSTWEGKPAIHILTRDVTQRKRAEEELRRLKLGIERSGEAIFLTDPEGVITYVNPAFETIYGYTREEALGKTPRILKSGTLDPEIYRIFWETIRARQPTSGTITNRTKDGRLIEMESTVSPVEDAAGSLMGYIAIQRDITQRKASEEALQQYAARVALLHQLDQAILSAQTPEEMSFSALERLQRLVGGVYASICLFDHEHKQVQVLAALGAPADNLTDERRLKLYDVQVVAMLERGDPILIDDLSELAEMNAADSALLASGVRSHVCVPLISHGRLIGMLNLGADRPYAIQDSQIHILQGLADQLAIAIEDARLREQLQEHSENLELVVAERTEELERIKDRVEAILNSSPDPILLLSPEGLIETANPAFLALFGYAPDDVFNLSLTRLAAAQQAYLIADGLAAARSSSQVARVAITACRASGGSFDADLALASIRDGAEVTGIVCSLRDISALKEVERMKDAFVSNVSHELRTPITSLKLYHQLLSTRPDKWNDYMASLMRETYRLERIVEDLLDLSRLDQHRVLLAPVSLDLNQLAQQYVEDRIPLAEKRQLQFSMIAQPDLPAVWGDPGLLGQVLSILLTNALSYTPPGGAIQVLTHQHPNASERWIGLTVRDSGPGIPPEERPQLFERFYRGSASRRTNSPGTGLGLAIAREIAALHDARLAIYDPAVPPDDSYPGAVFTLWLPDGASEPPAVSNLSEG